MPTIIREYGYRFFFYSNEGSEPPHIHVSGNGGEMKVWIPSLQVASVYNLGAKEQKKIMSVVRKQQDFILEKWNEFASRKH